jgi:hypothetical protein
MNERAPSGPKNVSSCNDESSIPNEEACPYRALEWDHNSTQRIFSCFDSSSHLDLCGVLTPRLSCKRAGLELRMRPGSCARLSASTIR